MKAIHYLFLSLFIILSFSCETLKTITTTTGGGSTEPTNAEIIGGLKQALEVGAQNAVGILNKQDGYFKDELVKIVFPPDAIKVANTLRDLGMGSLVDNFIESMNRGAERAAKEAGPIFVSAIKQMSLNDGKNILFGADNAATEYFRGKTSQNLYTAFYPQIKTAMDATSATKYWSEITTRYNKIPLVKKVNTDVTDYATHKALDGVFVKLAVEEKKIRKNPLSRTTDLLKKVFKLLD